MKNFYHYDELFLNPLVGYFPTSQVNKVGIRKLIPRVNQTNYPRLSRDRNIFEYKITRATFVFVSYLGFTIRIPCFRNVSTREAFHAFYSSSRVYCVFSSLLFAVNMIARRDGQTKLCCEDVIARPTIRYSVRL